MTDYMNMSFLTESLKTDFKQLTAHIPTAQKREGMPYFTLIKAWVSQMAPYGKVSME